MTKAHSNDMAEMQRWRLKKVVDPLKHIISVSLSGYGVVKYNQFNQHQNTFMHDQVYTNPNSLLLLSSAFPLAYATKSILIPVLFVWSTLLYKISTQDTGFYRQLDT